MSPQIVLPITTIQRDFLDVIADVHNGVVPSEAIWVSCYKTDCPSVHGKINVVLDEVDRDSVLLQVREGDVQLERNGVSYAVSCPSLEVNSTPVLLPSRQFADPEHTNPQRPPRRITAFDISPDGTQFACGYLDGAVRLASTAATPSLQQRIPKSHLSTVTALSFFPSSRVLLTAGADFTLTVLPAAPEPDSSASPTDPVRVLKGHSRAITATAIIARGRNVLSAAKDGTLRLWDVSGGAQIRMLGSGKGKYTPINAMVVEERGDIDTGAASGAASGVAFSTDPREVDTVDKLVFCALQDGSFEVFDLGAQISVFQSEPIAAEPLTAIAFSASQGWLATGSAGGLVTVYSTKAAFSSQPPLCAFARNGASIEDLAFCPLGLVVVTDDGLPYIARLTADPGSAAVQAEIVGSDCEAVRVVKVRGREIWTAGDDGVVRVYDI
ncbi:WD40 repeat-like protein [Athelia psychrophila]|uniref:WD40 repeat-like protein n=1 Tax=Athelia psychrophila TaxID=1759441 RepID=A0A166WR87_9AGAM|nr:WD40 repeat-like protein [Fibularhizoctonia sp. CBS 109695]